MTRDANFMVGVSLKIRVTERRSDALCKHGKQMMRQYTPEKKTHKTSVEGPCRHRPMEAVVLHRSAFPTHEQSLSLTESIPPTHAPLSGGDFVGSDILSQNDADCDNHHDDVDDGGAGGRRRRSAREAGGLPRGGPPRRAIDVRVPEVHPRPVRHRRRVVPRPRGVGGGELLVVVVIVVGRGRGGGCRCRRGRAPARPGRGRWRSAAAIRRRGGSPRSVRRRPSCRAARPPPPPTSRHRRYQTRGSWPI